MKHSYLIYLQIFFVLILQGADSRQLRGWEDARNLSPEPFIWQPYLIFDYLASSSINNPARPLSMIVLWRASSSTCDICWAEPSQSTCDTAGSGPLSTNDQFQYNITGIDFEQTYEYNVTCGVTTLSGSFLTPPQEPTSSTASSTTKILAYGDSRDGDEGKGTGLPLHDKIARRMQYNTDDTKSDWYGALALHTGDYVDNGECLSNWESDIMSVRDDTTYLREFMSNAPLNGCRGNHESGDKGCGTEAPWYSKFPEVFPFPFVTDFEALTYSFDYGNTHVISIDQYTEGDGTYDRLETSYGYCENSTACTGCSQHYEWLKQDLETANNDRDVKPFSIGIMHEPLYSVGGGHSNEEEPCFEKMLEDMGVNIMILAGHNHYYSRAEKRHPNGKKIYHITTGGGGYCCHNPDLPITDWPNARKVVSVNHYCRMESIINATDRYLCFEAIDIDGDMIDFFEIGDRPDTYDHCKCQNNITCDDNRLCNGREMCDTDSGLCIHDPDSDPLPCGDDEPCFEDRNGIICGCESLSAQECEKAKPFCGIPTQNGKLKCTGDETYPTGPENCTDGVDNDFNGYIDCDDPACFDACKSVATTSSTQAVPTTTTTSGSTSTTTSTSTTASSSSTSTTTSGSAATTTTNHCQNLPKNVCKDTVGCKFVQNSICIPS